MMPLAIRERVRLVDNARHNLSISIHRESIDNRIIIYLLNKFIIIIIFI